MNSLKKTRQGNDAKRAGETAGSTKPASSKGHSAPASAGGAKARSESSRATDAPAGRTGGGKSATRPQRHAVLERNLERYPWSRLSDEHGDQAQLQLLLDQAGVEGAAWTVIPPPGDRVPGPFDADVYIALATLYNTQIPRERRSEQRTIVTSLGELAEIMNRERGGSTYQAIRASLNRLRRTEVRAVRTFREGDTVAEERVFSVVGEFAFRYRRDGDRAQTGVKVEFPSTIADSIARGHIRLLDVGLYFQLETPTARKLYRYLDWKRWRGREARTTLSIPLRELAEELPIDREAPSHIKRTLEPAHEQLVASGFLASATFEERPQPKKRRPIWWVTYVFGAQAVTSIGPAAQATDTADLAPAPPTPPSGATSARGTPSDSKANGTRVKSASAAAPTANHNGRGRREAATISDVVAEILGTLRDDHSVAFYSKVAKVMPLELIRAELGNARQMVREGQTIQAARKTFTASMRRVAKEIGVSL